MCETNAVGVVGLHVFSGKRTSRPWEHGAVPVRHARTVQGRGRSPLSLSEQQSCVHGPVHRGELSLCLMQQKDRWLGRRETWFTIWSLKCIISPPNLEKLPFTNTSSVIGNTSIVIPLALQELLWSHNLMYVTCSEYPVYTHRHQHLWTKGYVLCGQTYMARPQFCYRTPCFVSSSPTRLQLWNVRNTQLSVFFFWM